MEISFVLEESNLLKGVWIIKPSIAKDKRGNIWTSFLKDDVEKLLPAGLHFKHDKFSVSRKNVLRGIHGDEKTWKLVTCVYGEIFQVVVDCRENSKTYRKSQSFVISEKSMMSILIPPGFGNAFYVNSNEAVYYYKLAYEGLYVDHDKQFSYRWDDSGFNIKWPSNNPILSYRDESGYSF